MVMLIRLVVERVNNVADDTLVRQYVYNQVIT